MVLVNPISSSKVDPFTHGAVHLWCIFPQDLTNRNSYLDIGSYAYACAMRVYACTVPGKVLMSDDIKAMHAFMRGFRFWRWSLLSDSRASM